MAVATVIYAAVAAVSAYTAYATSSAQADQQSAYNEQVREEAIRQYKELDGAESDAVYESHAQSLQAQREFLQARSSIELQSAASGTYGQSVDVAIRDLHTGLGQRMSDIAYTQDRNFDAINNASQRARAGAGASQVTIQQPSYFKAFSTGLRTYSQASNIGEGIRTTYNQTRTFK